MSEHYFTFREYLTPNNFLSSARDILVIEKSNAGLESEDLGFLMEGCSWVVIRAGTVIRMRRSGR